MNHHVAYLKLMQYYKSNIIQFSKNHVKVKKKGTLVMNDILRISRSRKKAEIMLNRFVHEKCIC